MSGNWIQAPRTDYNLYAGSLGGPVVPGAKNLNFFLSGERRWLRDRYSTYHSPVFNQQLEAMGLDTDLTPYNSSLGWTGQGQGHLGGERPPDREARRPALGRGLA